jgi:hypothetical protein
MTPGEIREACDRFKPGLYVHTKTGNLYRALFLAAHHDNRQPWVVYLSLSRGSLNIRPLKGTKEELDGWDDMVAVKESPDGVTHTTVPRFQFENSHIDGVTSTRESRMLRTLLTLVKGVPVVGDLIAKLDREGGEIMSADFGPAADTVEKRAQLLFDTMTGKIPTRDITDEVL